MSPAIDLTCGGDVDNDVDGGDDDVNHQAMNGQAAGNYFNLGVFWCFGSIQSSSYLLLTISLPRSDKNASASTTATFTAQYMWIHTHQALFRAPVIMNQDLSSLVLGFEPDTR